MEGNQAERRRKEQDQDPGRKEHFRPASEPREETTGPSPVMSNPPRPYNSVRLHVGSEEVHFERSAPDPHLVSTATGGVEDSCPHCLLPFGLVITLMGLAVTGVAYAHDTHGSVLSVLGLALLGTGVLGTAGSCIMKRCWCRHLLGWRRGSITLLMDEQLQKAIV